MTEPVRIAQVGVGYWGKNLLRNFASLEAARVVGVCDRDPEVLRRVEHRHPDVPTTQQYADLVAREDVEAVAIATETPEHYEMVSAALEAGKHVFVEKPLTETAAQAERLVEQAAARDRRLMVGHLLLYHPAFEHVKRLVDDGELGQVHYLYSQRTNLGIVRSRENAFQSLAPHDLAVACWLLDADPAHIAAQGAAYLQDDIEDVVFATVRFEGGKLAHLHTSWLDPSKVRTTTVVGSEKMAVIDDTASVEKVRIYDKGVEPEPDAEHYADYAEVMQVRYGDTVIPRIETEEPLRRECRHFLMCVRTGQTPRSDGRSGLTVVRLLEEAQRAFRRNSG